jgi:hypothetical protein
LFEYSEDYTQSAWTKANTAIISNTATSPDGTQNADKVYPTSSGSARYIYNNTSSGSSVHTISAYVKAGGKNVVWLYIEGYAAYGVVYFDLSDQSIQVVAGSTSTPSGTITAVGNDWYRISLTTGSAFALTSGSGIGTSDAKGSLSVSPNGTDGIYVWGAQLEAGSYPTSYIKTTSASVTRLADTCYKTGVADWIGQTEGVLFGEFYVPQIITAGSYVRTIINDGTSLNQIAFFYYPDGRIQATSSVGGSIVVSFNIPLFGLTAGTHKFAFGYKLNDYVLFVDGVNVGIDTSATVPSMSVLNLYDTSGGSMYYKHATIYKTRLSNSELAALTTI